MKQSSIEWLMDKLFDLSCMVNEQLEWFEQAKAMHKKEIEEAYEAGSHIVWDEDTLILIKKQGYYNDTFNTKEK